jgi:lysophospholipase L1-like esterase
MLAIKSAFGGLLRRILTAALLAAAVAVTTGCAAGPPPVSDKVQAAYESGRSLAPAVTKPAAVFFGDSYTHGTGASTATTSWVPLVSAAMGWGTENLGRGGTGYVATSNEKGCGLAFCPNYDQMINEHQGKPTSLLSPAGRTT